MDTNFYANFEYLCNYYCLDKKIVCESAKLTLRELYELKKENKLPTDESIQYFANIFRVNIPELLYGNMSLKKSTNELATVKSNEITLNKTTACRFCMAILIIAQIALFFAPFCSVKDAGNSSVSFITLSACFSINVLGVSVSIKFLEIIYSIYIISSIILFVVDSCDNLFNFTKKTEFVALVIRYVCSLLNVICLALLLIIFIPLENLVIGYGAILSAVVAVACLVVTSVFARTFVSYEENLEE